MDGSNVMSAVLIFFQWVLDTSALACVTVGLILLAKVIFKRWLTPRWHYLLWLLLLARLILPWTLESPYSVFNLFVWDTQIELSQNAPAINQGSMAEVLPLETEETVQAGVKVIPESHLDQDQSGTILYGVLLAIWLSGVIGISLYTIYVNLRFFSRIRKEPEVRDPKVRAALEHCKQLTSVSKEITMIESKQVTGPTLAGFLRPILLLNPLSLQKFDQQELRYIFLHELAHVKRKDIAVNWLMHGLLILHWFNPLLWFAYYKMREDQEVACDSLALAYLHSGERSRYGLTLIKLMENWSKSATLAGAVQISVNKSQLKRRIQMIALPRKTYKWSLIGLAVLVAIGIIVLTGPKGPEKSDIDLDPQTIINQAQIGWSQEKVKSTFGNQYVETTGAKDGEPLWRYDFTGREGYIYNDPIDSDSVDLEGLENGLMRMQLFVHWDEKDHVSVYSLYYKEDSKILNYRLTPNGEKINTIIGDETGNPPAEEPPFDPEVEALLAKMQVGLSKQQAESSFGTQYVETTGAKDGEPLWRYDFVGQEGYVYKDPIDSDSIDLDGLKNGLMRMQLFIEWSKEDVVDNMALYYKGKDDKIYEYLLFSDGGERVTEI